MHKSTQLLSIISLIISLASLAISLTAYSRVVAPELSRGLTQELQASPDPYREVQMNLLSVQAELNSNQDYQQAAEQVAEIRSDLNQVLQKSESELDSFGQTLSRDLAILEEQLRQQSIEALSTIEVIIKNFEESLRT